MDSPRSEAAGTRFSTPVSELDDHRSPEVQSPRPYVNNENRIENARPAELFKLDVPEIEVSTSRQPNQLLSATQPEFCLSPISVGSRSGSRSNSLDPHAPIARDFENAVIDDDNKSGIEPFPHSPESGAGRSTPVRRLSRRGRLSRGEANRSRASSGTSSTSSRPTSMFAFAEQRARERSNTFGSIALSDVEQLHRTVSGGTHRRRPTFSSNNNIPVFGADDEEISPSDNENSYKDEDLPKESRIDYEAIEEFVAENERGRQMKEGSVYGYGANDSDEEKNPGTQVPVPQITTQSASPVRDSDHAELGSELEKKREKGHGHRTLFARRQSVAGPPRFAFFSSQMEETMHVAELKGLILDGQSFADIFELPNDEGAWWLDVLNPTPDELEMFREAFGIHPLTKEDIEEKEDREKVELFNNYYFVNFKSFENDKEHEDYLEGINVYMIVFREGILTFSYQQTPHAAGVRKKISRLRNYESLTADWICYAMVDHIVDFFFPVMRGIEMEADQIEDSVFVARAEDAANILHQIGDCRKKVMSLMRLLGGKADVIKGFAKRCNAQYTVTPRGEIGLYLSDIQDHIVTMMSNLGHFEKMLSRSHSNYLAQLSVDNLIQGNRANDVLSKITVIATIIVPMNLVCGLFGMNVPVPGNPDGGSLAWFGGILGFLGFIVIFSLSLARWFRYI